MPEPFSEPVKDVDTDIVVKQRVKASVADGGRYLCQQETSRLELNHH